MMWLIHEAVLYSSLPSPCPLPACSSSLVACHLALDHMRSAAFDAISSTTGGSKRSDGAGAAPAVVGAVVGGVGLLLNHEPTLMFQRAGECREAVQGGGTERRFDWVGEG